MHGLPDLMTKVAAEELQRMNYLVAECNVIYYPQVRREGGGEGGRGRGRTVLSLSLSLVFC